MTHLFNEQLTRPITLVILAILKQLVHLGNVPMARTQCTAEMNTTAWPNVQPCADHAAHYIDVIISCGIR